MMGNNLTDSWEHTQQQIDDYLAARMDEAAQEAFERRMFGDPDLSLEVERAAELKAALADEPTARRPTRWMPLAAAAAVMAVAVGIWVAAPLSEVGDTPRGERTALVVEVAADGAAYSASWGVIAEATSYELLIYVEDGSVIDRRTLPVGSTSHRFTIDAETPGRLLIRVRAFDSFRKVRADSGLLPLP